MTREKSRDLKLTLENLVDVLARYFDNMDPVRCEDVLIILGNTGCGKSTLLGAMVHGSDALEEKVVEEWIETHKGKKKKITKFIDYKEDSASHPFKIGHSQVSETFYPTIQDSLDQSFNYLDVAGLQDTGGHFFEFINMLIVKKIFSIAQKVRFLVPITDK